MIARHVNAGKSEAAKPSPVRDGIETIHLNLIVASRLIENPELMQSRSNVI